MAKYEVVWATTIEANSPAEAAYLAYKQQRAEAVADASFNVRSGEDDFAAIRIHEEAAIEMLTERELAVAILVKDGATNAEIGRELNITERTVKAHVSAIFGKLHVTGRVALAAKLIHMELESGHVQ